MFFPLLPLLPASRLDTWLLGRITLISGLILPGVGITVHQYRDARVAVPVFTACFLAAAALGKLQASRAIADETGSLSPGGGGRGVAREADT
jgi:hypothetical protein